VTEPLTGETGVEGPVGDRLDGEEPPEPATPAGATPPEEAAPPEGEGRSDHARPKLIVGKTPGVTADDTVAEAGRKVLRFHFARMLNREAGTRAGDDPEELHSMRVATRRMRAAWRVFGDGFRPGRTRRLRRPLRDIAARLGAVRDLDVLIEAAELHRAELPAAERRALEPLLGAWQVDRDAARVLLLRELDGAAYGRFVDEFRVFVATESAGAAAIQATQPHRVRDTAPARLWAAYATVRAYEPVLRWADVETLHDLRIAAKWLRYSLEFVREAIGEGSAPLIEATVGLQDHLGQMHDADVSAALARQYLVARAGSLSGAQSAAIARYLLDREREVARLRRTVGRPWRRVAGPVFRRGLGRTVAGL
jgi:CHAD domain-containing protein